MPRKSKNKQKHFNQQHTGNDNAYNSSHGNIMKGRSAPYLKKEQVVLTDVIQVPSNSNLGDDAQIVRVGPNGLKFFNSAGTSKPQSAIWVQYAEMYEFYQVDGFSCRWIPNKFEFQTDPSNVVQTVVAGPSFSCFDPEDDFPQTASAIQAYDTCKIAGPYHELHNHINNYKGLSLQKQEKTILKTGDGVLGSEELYIDAAGFVTYMINPWRNPVNTPSLFLGWMQFSVTYTFSGLKRPGAALEKRAVEQQPIVGNPGNPIPPLPPQPQAEKATDVTLSMSQFEHIVKRSIGYNE